MGIGITGISRAKLLPCTEDEKCPCLEEDDEGELMRRDEVCCVDAPGSRKDAVKMGCYTRRAGRSNIRPGLQLRRIRRLDRRTQPDGFRCGAQGSLEPSPSVPGQAFRRIDRRCGCRRRCDRSRHLGQAAWRFRGLRGQGEKVLRDIPRQRVQPSAAQPKIGECTAQRNLMGLSAVVGLAESLGGNVPGWDEGENLDWMWNSYQQFRRAFRLAKNAGIVVFY